VSLIATAQWMDSDSINWVEFLPASHSHLVQYTIKLAPSIPTAKVKQVMFVYILKVLNGNGPAPSFFAPHCICVSHKRRTRQPREGGAQPVSAMAVNPPPPVAVSDPVPPGPLSPGLVLGDGDPSLEEQAGAGASDISWQASSSPRVSLTPSDCTVVPMHPLRPGLFCPPL